MADTLHKNTFEWVGPSQGASMTIAAAVSICPAGGVHRDSRSILEHSPPEPMTQTRPGSFALTKSLPRGLFHYVFQVQDLDGTRWRHAPAQRTTRLANGRSVNYVNVPAPATPALPAFDDVTFTENTPLVRERTRSMQQAAALDAKRAGCCIIL